MAVIYVNKPKGITSFDVCYKLRKVFHTKKIGHTGTLDPNATGVMIVLVDNATKANQFLLTDTKEYIAEVKINVETDTLDIDGNILLEKDDSMPERNVIEDALNKYLGVTTQIPPITSAIKVDGKKLYEYQRENKEVKIPARQIEVMEINLLHVDEQMFTFRCLVSSGTYIRALVRDVLKDLGLIGILNNLTRTKVDKVSVEECDSLEEIEKGNVCEHSLFEILSRKYETIELKDPRLAINGRRLVFNSSKDRVLVTDGNKECIAIYEKDGDEYKCIRGLR